VNNDFTADYRNIVGRKDKELVIESHPASSVHPPLTLSNADDLLVPSDKCVMEESMRIAQMSAEIRNERCLTVVHISQPPSLSDYRTLSEMELKLERLLKLFPDVDIVFENITPFRDLGLGLTEFCNGYYDANVRMAQHLRHVKSSYRLRTRPQAASDNLEICFSPFTDLAILLIVFFEWHRASAPYVV